MAVGGMPSQQMVTYYKLLLRGDRVVQHLPSLRTFSSGTGVTPHLVTKCYHCRKHLRYRHPWATAISMFVRRVGWRLCHAEEEGGGLFVVEEGVLAGVPVAEQEGAEAAV